MTRLLDEVIQANHRFVNSEQWQNFPKAAGKAARKVAIFTCMDSRLTEFIVPALGLQRGDAKIIKNAGNTFLDNVNDSVIVSLAVAIYKLGVEEVLVVGHYDCGMAKTEFDDFLAQMRTRGIEESVIESMQDNLKLWFNGFSCLLENIGDVCERIRTSPLLPKDVPVHGLLIHPLTGMLQVIVKGYEYVS